LYCIVLYCVILYCIALYCIVAYYSILYCFYCVIMSFEVLSRILLFTALQHLNSPIQILNQFFNLPEITLRYVTLRYVTLPCLTSLFKYFLLLFLLYPSHLPYLLSLLSPLPGDQEEEELAALGPI
jgi:hypothetical protein